MKDEDQIVINGSLIFLYLGWLTELGLIEGAEKLTPKGFDLAIDAYKKGHRVPEIQIKGFLIALNSMPNELIDKMTALIEYVQERGLEYVKEELKQIK